MIEEWKPINGFEGYYEISNIGRVKALKRVDIISRGRKSTKKERFLKCWLNNKGYPSTVLTINRERKDYLVHRLVAEHFIDNPNNYPIINHLDGIKTNCVYTNLQWCDYSMNQQHAYDNNLRVKKLSTQDKEKILKLRDKGLTYSEIASNYDVSYQMIGRICKNNQK